MELGRFSRLYNAASRKNANKSRNYIKVGREEDVSTKLEEAFGGATQEDEKKAEVCCSTTVVDILIYSPRFTTRINHETDLADS